MHDFESTGVPGRLFILVTFALAGTLLSCAIGTAALVRSTPEEMRDAIPDDDVTDD